VPLDPSPHVDFADSPDAAAWIGHRRMAWELQAGYRVGNEVPQGYATYLRILHRSSFPGMPEEAVLDALATSFERCGDSGTGADERLAAVISEQEGIDVQPVAWEDRLDQPPGPASWPGFEAGPPGGGGGI
jgi:hypothetical protein